MITRELDPSVEVAHLRRVLDTQPGFLMRLGADGTVLAANDAARQLIGVTSGAQVLGRDFSAWVPPDQRDQWAAFTAGVAQGHPASFECDVVAPSGDRHPTLFHGVPLTDHPDGVASIVLSARSVSRQHQLEAAVIDLEEQLRKRDAERLKALSDVAESENRQRDLTRQVEALQASLPPPGAEEERDEEVRRLKANIEARDAALGAAQGAQRTAEARAAQALAARQECEAAMREVEAAHANLAASHASLTAEHGRLLHSLRQQVAHLDALANGAPASGGWLKASATPAGFGAGREEAPV